MFLSGALLISSLPMTVHADVSDPAFSHTTSTDVSDTEDNVDKVYELADNLHEENLDVKRRTGGFSWDAEGKQRSWTYYNGIHVSLL